MFHIRRLGNCLAGLTAAALLFAGGVASAQVSIVEYEAAAAVMGKANAGDKSLVPVAVEAFTKLNKQDPSNAVVLVNLGAVTSMMARTTMLPWKKISYAEDGMALQDKALAMLNASTEKVVYDGVETGLRVKFIAANTFVAVPSFFNRGAQGTKLMADVQSSQSFEAAPLAFKGAVWLRAAKLAAEQKKPDDAKALATKVLEANAPQADAAKSLIQTL